NVILFIDEIHTVIGAGRAGDSLDAADILKPALSRGEIKCIGATTIDEYRKYIENDSALERRFTPILVNEPTIAQTKKILYAIKPLFENYHKVSINKEAIEAAVELSA
ncbi:MAG: ATP-dependent Clp protease ATP-binding subunit ClpC, partial [Candidatus Bathyarchaeia archaeon]